MLHYSIAQVGLLNRSFNGDTIIAIHFIESCQRAQQCDKFDDAICIKRKIMKTKHMR